MNNTAQVTHESETQRQFVRLQLPANALIDGKHYNINDLSSGGMSIRHAEKDFSKGQLLEFTLLLPFADFSLDVDLKAEIQHIDKKANIAGCRFVDLTTNQVSILNHVIKAFMAGDLINADSVINVVARENFVNVRQHKAHQDGGIASQIKKYGIYCLIAFAILALSTFIINNIMEKLFIIKSPYGAVVTQEIEILTPQSGVFTAALTGGVRSIKKGQVIGYISPVNDESENDPLKIVSPCDCFITSQHLLEGEFKPENTAIFTLAPQKGDILVNVTVPVEQAHKLNIGTQVVFDISGNNDFAKGAVQSIQLKKENPVFNTEQQANIIIKPEKPLTLDSLNKPVFVEFHL